MPLSLQIPYLSVTQVPGTGQTPNKWMSTQICVFPLGPELVLFMPSTESGTLERTRLPQSWSMWREMCKCNTPSSSPPSQ